MTGGFKTRREAETARTALLASLDQGGYVEPTKQTVGQFLDDWIEAVRPSLRPSTHASYAKNVRVHVSPRLGAVPLRSLDAGHLSTLYGQLLVDGNQTTGGGLSPRTVRYVHTIIRRALQDAVAWGRLARNPALVAKPPTAARAASGPPKAWTAQQLGVFLRATRTDPEWPVWVVLATTGARRGEILGLRWEDVDLDSGVVRVTHSLTHLAGRVTLDSPKTAGSRRRVVLDTRTMGVLRQRRVQQAADRLAAGPAWANQWGLVFTSPLGWPISPHDFSLRFVRRVRAVGLDLPVLSPHGLRHTWASVALTEGVHPKVVQERLGHASIAITLGIYSHALEGLDGGAAETVATAVWG